MGRLGRKRHIEKVLSRLPRSGAFTHVMPGVLHPGFESYIDARDKRLRKELHVPANNDAIAYEISGNGTEMSGRPYTEKAAVNYASRSQFFIKDPFNATFKKFGKGGDPIYEAPNGIEVIVTGYRGDRPPNHAVLRMKFIVEKPTYSYAFGRIMG